jgi:hypothetical protein
MTPEAFCNLQSAQTGEHMADKEEYQEVVGSLLHLVQCTKPDLALAVGALAKYCSAPSFAHHAALLDVVKYVWCTASRGITFGHRRPPLEVWCDANFAVFLSGYKTEHHGLGRRNVRGSCGMGKQKAANYSCLYNGGRVSSLWRCGT